MQVIIGLIIINCSDLLAEKLINLNNKCYYGTSANYTKCIFKLQIFQTYRHPWVPLCPDKGGLTVSVSLCERFMFVLHLCLINNFQG